jgi:outer membrane immunogenic protein
MRKLLSVMGLVLLGTAAATIAAAQDTRCAQKRFEGFYAGAHVGATTHDTTWNDPDNWADNFSFDFNTSSVNTTRSGLAGGLQGGYNYQPGCIVVGVEIDGSWADLSGSRTASPAAAGTRLTLRDNAEMYGTIRVRAGVVVDSLLIYLTGGPAFAKLAHSWRIVDPAASERFSAETNRWGGAGGAGVEWAFTDRLSVKAEGLYLKFGTVSTSGFSNAGAQQVRFENQDSLLIGRLGVNFKF